MKIHCLRNPSSAGYEKAGAPSAKTTLRPCLRRYFSLPLSSRPFPPPSPPTAVPFHHHASRFPPQPVSCDTFISCIQQFRASSSNLAGLRPSFRGRSSLRFPSKKSFLHFLIFFLPLSLLLLFFFPSSLLEFDLCTRRKLEPRNRDKIFFFSGGEGKFGKYRFLTHLNEMKKNSRQFKFFNLNS